MSLATEHIAITTPKAFTLAAVRHICAKHEVSFRDMMGDSRLRSLVLARCEAIHYLRRVRGWSTSSIGRYLDLDHTTVIHHWRDCKCQHDEKAIKEKLKQALHFIDIKKEVTP